MRYVLAALLLTSLAVPAKAADDRPLDKLAVDAIEHLTAVRVRDDKLSEDKEADVYIELSAAAHHDRKIENALVFAECGSRLLKDTKYTNLLVTLSAPNGGPDWNVLQTMARKYKADGVLPIVNYAALTKPDGPKKLDAAFSAPPDLDEDYDALEGIYWSARQKGLTPEQAYARVLKQPNAQAGLSVVRKQLFDAGNLALTGYDMSSAGRDVPTYMEAAYAILHSDARDIGGVTPAISPLNFISDRVEQGMRQDMRTMLRPVHTLVDNFLYPATRKTDTPRAADTPNFDDINRTPDPASGGGSGMPTWDEMKKPPMHSTALRPGLVSQTWWALRDSPTKDIELKPERIAYGIDVFKIRQANTDRRLRVISATTHISLADGNGDLLPNKPYVAEFNVWCWGEKGTSAYFGDGSGGTIEPPANARAYLPVANGKTVTVRVPFKTDKTGKGRIALFVRGRCAAELGEFYEVYPAGPRAQSKR